MGNFDTFASNKNMGDEIFGISEVPSDGETIDLNRAAGNAYATIKNENPY